MNKGRIWLNAVATFATLLLCYIPLCHRINIFCIQIWDESRNITNAIEMLHNHNWLIRYFENRPDMWELKPPFLVWCQALSLRVFGFNEVAARLPSMFFSFATVLFLIWMTHKISGEIYGGLIAALVLVSSSGYIGEHGARFGDHDVVLAFFTTTLVSFAYLYFSTKQLKYLILVFISLLLGWFTKSITAFLFLPAILFWSVAQKQLKEILLQKTFWIGTVMLMILIISYYLIREAGSPGYINQVWMNELFGRYFSVSKDYVYEQNSFWFYSSSFLNGRFSPFFVVFLLGCIYLFVKKDFKTRNFLIYLFISLLTFFIIISAGSKNNWYDIPIYPLAALFIGVLSVQLYQNFKNTGYRLTFNFILFTLIFSGYSSVFHYIFILETPSKDNWRTLCYYFKNENNIKPKHLKIIHDGYFAPLYLYIEDAKSNNLQITLSKTVNVQVGDTCLMADIKLIERTDSLFQTKTILQTEGCVLKSIVAQK